MRFGWLLAGASCVAILLLVCVPDARGAETPALEEAATTFSRLFLNGEYERLPELMSAEMRSAMTPAASEQIRAQIVAANGEVQSIGDAWAEDVLQGYRRFRVPVKFAGRVLDLRIVFDSEGKVAGFFHVPHLPPPSERGADARPRPDLAGHWEGTIDIPDTPMPVGIDLVDHGGAWSGSFDSPAQGVKGIPLEAFVVAGDTIEFAIAGIPGKPTFQGRLANGSIKGTFSQMGQDFPFTLGRTKAAGPQRPQEPRPPFPYAAEEVSYPSGTITLAGTLTIPQGAGPFPAALLISGSGPQNRDEELLGHKPFLVLADHLTRAGIAILRVDDRGVGGSTGNVSQSTSADFAEDALAGVGLLKRHARIDPKRIGLIGHSEGGVVAPLAASRSDDVAFLVLLAGTGVPGDEILTHQMRLILRAEGVGPEQIESIGKAQRELLGLIKSGAPQAELQSKLGTLTRLQLDATTAIPDAEALSVMTARGMQGLDSPWFRFFLGYDPRPALRQVRVPVLALCGSRDLQVDPEQNLPEIEKALRAGGNPDVTVRTLAGLNHLFQSAETGSPAEYYSIEETVHPTALEAIRDWILARFGPAVPSKG